jgi:hypothetical protein
MVNVLKTLSKQVSGRIPKCSCVAFVTTIQTGKPVSNVICWELMVQMNNFIVFIVAEHTRTKFNSEATFTKKIALVQLRCKKQNI